MNFSLPTDISTYTQWSVIVTIASIVLTIMAFLFSWGFRFRLVGITGFMGVLTVGLFGLSLGLFTRTTIPGAVRYTLVYDNGANQAVIALPLQVSPSAIEATLRQASSDLYSGGRLGLGKDSLKVLARTVLHPQEGVSVPLYLGEAQRPLGRRQDDQIEIKIYEKNVAQLPKG